MTAAKEEESALQEREWQWCLVGNIVGEHLYGENKELRRGNKQFRPNAKVFVNLVYGGMGHESILVIGLPRGSGKYIEIVIARKCKKICRKFPAPKSVQAGRFKENGSIEMGLVGKYGRCPRRTYESACMAESGRGIRYAGRSSQRQ